MPFMNDTFPIAEAPEEVPAKERAFRSELNQKLRAPLNAIIGFAELLALRPGTATQDADVQRILKAARDLLGIINTELGEGSGAEQNIRAAEEPAAGCDVLYIEDDPVNFTLVERILEFRPGLKLMHARSGEAGVEMAQSHRARMVLLDLNLPDIHGSEVLKRPQADPATARMPVVTRSDHATHSQIERLLTAGAGQNLTKPLDI